MLLELPWPPSVNTYWRHVVMGRRSAVLLSERGRDYRKQVVAYVAEACAECGLDGRLHVMMILHAPTKRRYDLDNRPKAVLDGLQHAGVYVDDEQIDRLEVIRGEVRPGDGAVVVSIEAIKQ